MHYGSIKYRLEKKADSENRKNSKSKCQNAACEHKTANEKTNFC